jgi:hypothetical protein
MEKKIISEFMKNLEAYFLCKLRKYAATRLLSVLSVKRHSFHQQIEVHIKEST